MAAGVRLRAAWARGRLARAPGTPSLRRSLAALAREAAALLDRLEREAVAS